MGQKGVVAVREPPKVYTAFEPPPQVHVECGEGLTRQSEKDSCDINLIVKRYNQTGILPVTTVEGWYADVSEMGGYREAIEKVDRAMDAFMAQPPDLRNRFNNDPAEFLDFCSDPRNREEMIKLGLVEKPAEPAPKSAVEQLAEQELARREAAASAAAAAARAAPAGA